MFAGVDVVRDDGQALWHYLFTAEPGQTSAQQRLNVEVERVLAGFGITDQPIELCSLANQIGVTGLPGLSSATILRTQDYTIQVVVSQSFLPILTGAENVLVVATNVARNDEFDLEAYRTFLPIGWQLIVKGGSDEDVTQCNDGKDNDGDGLVDQLDPGCEDGNDDNESDL